jgi:hypothetical protein
MFLRLTAFCLMVAPAVGSAQAECVNFLSFAKGVTVKLEDGSVWSVRRQAHEVIRLEQTNAGGNYARYVEATYGVYQTESTRNGSATVSEYSYVRRVPEPAAGMDWTSNVRATTTKIGDTKADAWREKVHVTAGSVATVKIGSCRYAALGLDVGHIGGPYPTVQHFTYFPDLRFAIQTRITYPTDTVKKAAILSMKAD